MLVVAVCLAAMGEWARRAELGIVEPVDCLALLQGEAPPAAEWAFASLETAEGPRSVSCPLHSCGVGLAKG